MICGHVVCKVLPGYDIGLPAPNLRVFQKSTHPFVLVFHRTGRYSRNRFHKITADWVALSTHLSVPFSPDESRWGKGIYPGMFLQPWLAKAGQRLCILMPKITAIQVQKKNPNRVSISLDGQFAFGLSRIVAAWLNVGQELSEEKIVALQEEDARESAIQKALRFLGYRARSVSEVRENLQKHEIPESVVERTLKRLQETGLLNDQEFAQAWVENRAMFRPRSRRALALELRRKGLDDNVIQQTLEQTADETSLARDAGRKYLRKVQGLDWPDFRAKMGGFLARRGFSYNVVTPVLRELWAETRSNDETYPKKNEE